MNKFLLLLKKLYSSNKTEVEETKMKHTILVSDNFYGVIQEAIQVQRKHGFEGDDPGSVVRNGLSIYLQILNNLQGEGSRTIINIGGSFYTFELTKNQEGSTYVN